jgi:hypothetical protein
MADAPTYCAGTVCQESECCVEKETCASVTCGAGRSFKAGYQSIHCAAEECSSEAGSADEDTCCEDKDTCDNMTSGDGMTYCQTFTACGDTEQIPNAATQACPDGGCTAEVCCLSASGLVPAPVIETTLDQPAERDTFKVSFKIQASFDALENDPDLKEKLKEKTIETFAVGVGVDPKQCDAVFSRGSVNVEVTIRAEEGESLPSPEEMTSKVPEPSEVLAAIKTVPGVEAIKKDGIDFSVSEVTTAFFKEGSTAGVTEDDVDDDSGAGGDGGGGSPSPSPSPSPTPAEDAEEDEDDSSSIGLCTATSFIVAVGTLSMYV